MDDWLVMASSPHTYTIADELDFPIMILGCNILWKGVAQVWAVPTEQIRGNGWYVTKTAKDILLGIALKDKIRRFHCIVHSGIAENIKWIEVLGFLREGIMRKATPDKMDMYIYVKWYDKTLEDYYGRRTKKDYPRLQGDVAKLFRLDAGGAGPEQEGDVQRPSEAGHAGSEGRLNRVDLGTGTNPNRLSQEPEGPEEGVHRRSAQG